MSVLTWSHLLVSRDAAISSASLILEFARPVSLEIRPAIGILVQGGPSLPAASPSIFVSRGSISAPWSPALMARARKVRLTSGLFGREKETFERPQTVFTPGSSLVDPFDGLEKGESSLVIDADRLNKRIEVYPLPLDADSLQVRNELCGILQIWSASSSVLPVHRCRAQRHHTHVP